MIELGCGRFGSLSTNKIRVAESLIFLYGFQLNRWTRLWNSWSNRARSNRQSCTRNVQITRFHCVCDRKWTMMNGEKFYFWTIGVSMQKQFGLFDGWYLRYDLYGQLAVQRALGKQKLVSRRALDGDWATKWMARSSEPAHSILMMMIMRAMCVFGLTLLRFVLYLLTRYSCWVGLNS